MNKELYAGSILTEKILKIRAERLAQASFSQETRDGLITVVEFCIAHEIYAIELTHIRTIHPLKDLTYIPGAPPFIKGVFNLRGEIISAVDLKYFFNLPDQNPGHASHSIILSSGDMEFGILSDAVFGVREIHKDDIRDSLPAIAGIRQEYLKGVTAGGVAVLDDEKLLGDQKMIISL